MATGAAAHHGIGPRRPLTDATPAVTAMTPLVLVLILLAAFAHDIQPVADSPRADASPQG